MNLFCKPNQMFEEFERIHALLEWQGYGTLNFDARWKWAAIMSAREATLSQNETLDFEPPIVHSIDIGGGYSPIHHWCSLTERVVNVDRNFEDGWFEAKNRKFIGAQNTPNVEENITYVEQPFNRYAMSVPDNTIDRCYDGCSIIHFHKTNELGRHNDGCATAADHIFRILKPGGFFIMAADTCAPRHRSNTPEWLTAEQLVDCFTSSGLKQYGSVDWSTDGIYTYPANDGHLLTVSLHTFQKPL